LDPFRDFDQPADTPCLTLSRSWAIRGRFRLAPGLPVARIIPALTKPSRKGSGKSYQKG